MPQETSASSPRFRISKRGGGERLGEKLGGAPGCLRGLPFAGKLEAHRGLYKWVQAYQHRAVFCSLMVNQRDGIERGQSALFLQGIKNVISNEFQWYPFG